MFMVALVGVLLLVVVALCYRLWKLRQVGGTAAILRDVPAVGGHGWRHGVMRYRGGEAGFYRLSSLRWWPDRRLSRRGLEIVSRRAPRGDEFDIMTDAIVVLELRDTSPERAARLRGGAGPRGVDRIHVLAGVTPVAAARGAVTSYDLSASAQPSVFARALAAGLPQHVAVRIGHPRQDEQQVRQPVEVLGRQHADRFAVLRPPPAMPTARRGAPPCGRRAAAPTAACRRAG